MKRVTYGMVGGHLHAFIGEVHRKALNYDNRARLVAGCFSSDAEKNNETGQAYSLEDGRVYASYADMAEKESAREDGINFVIITTPNHLHYAVSKAFLEKGIHVVCEKPLCFEVAQAQELVELAEKKNLLFAVTYSYTGYTMIKVMKEMIANGAIGNVVSVNGEYIQEWLIDNLSPEQPGTAKLSVWRTDPQYSGVSNCVGDIGTHIENMIHYLTGLNIKRLAATVNRFGHPLDLNANMLIEYDNGVNGAYWCSQIAAGKLNGFKVRIYGDLGALEWEQHFPDYVQYTPKGKPTQTLSRGTGYITEQAGGYSRIPSGHPEGLYVAFANMYKNIISAVLKLKEGQQLTEADMDFATVKDGLNGVKFVHAVMESAEKGACWVDVN